MKNRRLETAQRCLLATAVMALVTLGSASAQNKAIGFTKDMPFSDGFVAGNTLYVAGQQGPDSHGKVIGTDITTQTTNAIAAVKKVTRDVVSLEEDQTDGKVLGHRRNHE